MSDNNEIPIFSGGKKKLFSIIRNKQTVIEIAVWRHFALKIFPINDAAQGYKAIFEMVKKNVATPCAYLYLSDDESQKLVLTVADFSDLKDWAQENGLDSRTEAELRDPEIVIKNRETFRQSGVLEMLGTNILNIPLHLKGKGFIGCLFVGPVLRPRRLKRNKHFLRVFSVAAANGVNRFREIERLREEVNQLRSKMNVSRRMLGSALELNRFVDLLLDLAITATRAEAGFVAITQPKKKTLKIRAHKNLPEGFLEKINLSAEDGLFEWSPDDGAVMILRDFDFVAEFQVKSILAVPLVENEKLLGAFALINFTRSEMFSDFSLSVLTNFTEQIKLVLNNSRLFDDFTRRYFSTLVAMSEAYDHRSPETAGHSRRVSDAAVKIAQKMQMEKSLTEHIRQAGLIHDLGMCGVVDVGEDFQADFNHPEIGASMIEALPIASALTEAVRTHHEWYDGWGFPNGLKGDQIPISGRILALAEYFVEATANTRFSEPLTPDKLREELELRTGKQFDPDVVAALVKWFEESENRDASKPFMPCWEFKGEPRDVCQQCPAFKSDNFCWMNPEVNCASHGDESCNKCFIFKEWLERIEKLISHKKLEVKEMEYKVEQREKFTLVKLSGEIDVSVAPQLRSLLQDLIGGGQENILVDLADVPFIDSSGLGIFVVAFKMAKAKSGDVKFVGAKPEVLKVIQLTRLDKHFQLFETLDEAESSFA
ncbi:MAG: anti-sigma factor antagonist [Calditrichaeota bacterium]|nr:anti-sigma factor antagonist [Calditrichota bacterium]